MARRSLEGATIVAVGGYGRGYLSPRSDIDIVVLVTRVPPPTDELRGFLYPMWDAGLSIGHSIGTPKDMLERASSDVTALTALLPARLVIGEQALFDELQDRLGRWIEKRRRALARTIDDSVGRAQRSAERGGWTLAPDIKNDIGGLRDIHAAEWLAAVAGQRLRHEPLERCEGVLLAVREALHQQTGRKRDRLHMDLQTKVAARIGLEGDDGADRLMAAVHDAMRAIEHDAGRARRELVAAVASGPRRSGSVVRLDDDVRLEDGYLVARAATFDLRSAMRVLAWHSRTGRPLAGATLARLRDTFAENRVGIEWDEQMLAAFTQLLGGDHSAAALELLDALGAWPTLIPQWDAIRCRPQHDPYHRYTVDAHSFMTVRELSACLTEEPGRGIALEAGPLHVIYLAALLHDIGKGSGRDHSQAGAEITEQVCARLGLAVDESAQVRELVRLHLLLPETATRRDLDDGDVIMSVAKAVGDARMLRRLLILAIADARATGPEAWTPWKEALLLELFRKTLIALERGEVPIRSDAVTRAREVEAYEPALAGRAAAILDTLPRTYAYSAPVEDIADELRMLALRMREREVRIRVLPGTEPSQVALTLCVQDRPGALARSAGVLALHRLSVLKAQAYSSTSGLALQRFVVTAPDEIDWARVEQDLRAAYSGRLALQARLERKARDYRVKPPSRPRVEILQDASDASTVVEVRAHDTLGLLHAIASAISELDLDIHVAKIDTLGSRVVDSFYVRTTEGAKLEDEQAAALRTAIEHRLQNLYR